MIHKNPKKALLYGIATVVMWSVVGTALKLSLYTLSPFQLTAIGLGVASIILGTIITFTGEYKIIFTLSKNDVKTILLQAFFLFLYYYIAFVGYFNLPAQIATAINNSWPFALVFINLFLFKDKLGKIELLGMLVAYSGVALVAFGGSSSKALGAEINILYIISMIMGTFFIAAFWLTKNRSDINHNVSLFLSFLVCAIAGLIASIIDGTSMVNVSKSSLFAAVALGFFEWGIPFVTWALALKLTNSVAGIGILSFFTPFLGLLWISFLLGEPILYTTIIGLCLCVTGTIIQQKYKIVKNDI